MSVWCVQVRVVYFFLSFSLILLVNLVWEGKVVFFKLTGASAPGLYQEHGGLR